MVFVFSGSIVSFSLIPAQVFSGGKLLMASCVGREVINHNGLIDGSLHLVGRVTNHKKEWIFDPVNGKVFGRDLRGKMRATVV